MQAVLPATVDERVTHHRKVVGAVMKAARMANDERVSTAA